MPVHMLICWRLRTLPLQASTNTLKNAKWNVQNCTNANNAGLGYKMAQIKICHNMVLQDGARSNVPQPLNEAHAKTNSKCKRTKLRT